MAPITAEITLHGSGCLASRGNVLAHAAAGGAVQAAALLDQDIGAETFVTVGSDVKRRFLAEEFAVPPERIFSSGDTSFVESIQRKRGCKGVVVVVKSLAGGLLHPGFDYLAESGLFMQIGKRGIEAGRRLAMTALARITSSMAKLEKLDDMFRAMQAKKHVSKTVLSVPPDTLVPLGLMVSKLYYE
ncbi:hypothetical protein LX32DRAFT_650638 [Colletotrichum zoysiae]|uniref:Enoyl reductase (ER) domain-containing protein n=1 Tax=Colletotrichum zoysiae TaxID=1216348 RepID=A0AAD9M4D7_9PEZI|nr:hypothetical protein LX32DRAFT_650638 [Colletotrichum zoysiae]